jgi:biopolymer transport protein ExbD
MRIPVRAREAGPRLTITPLVDICFNLIVFFGLASLYVKKETADPVTLPEAGQIETRATAEPRPLVITINAQRRISVAGEEIPSPRIERLIADRCGVHPAELHVRIRADKSVPYGDVKPLILACARRGVTNLEFAVQQK